MSNLMLTLDDAISVAKRYSDMDEDILRQELEQKCWVRLNEEDPFESITGLIMDINPEEITNQIKRDNLKGWCIGIQANMQLELIQIRRAKE